MTCYILLNKCSYYVNILVYGIDQLLIATQLLPQSKVIIYSIKGPYCVITFQYSFLEKFELHEIFITPLKHS